MIRRIFVLAGPMLCLAALSGCGQMTDLKPPPGKSLPVAPIGAGAQPESQDLLKPTTQAAPERSVELRKRSEEREDDPFDLPPE